VGPGVQRRLGVDNGLSQPGKAKIGHCS